MVDGRYTRREAVSHGTAGTHCIAGRPAVRMDRKPESVLASELLLVVGAGVPHTAIDRSHGNNHVVLILRLSRGQPVSVCSSSA
eukprot:357240-Chlamydomonas_euryale.AAC.11